MKVKVTISLPHNDLEWYHKEYPKNSLSATLTLLLNNFRIIHRDAGLTPSRAAKSAAKEVKDLIEDGVFEQTSEEEAEA